MSTVEVEQQYGNTQYSNFLLKPGFVNLNHGSFGTIPKRIAERQYQLLLQQESEPDKWFRDSYYKLIDISREKLAKVIRANNEDLVLVENASSAVNSILRSLNMNAGEKVLILSTAYGMVIETLNWLVKTKHIKIIQAHIDFPVAGTLVVV